MAMARRTQQERSEATTQAIKGAARKLFTAHGFDVVTIDDIAARAGVAKGAVYHHFASKRAIFARVLEQIQAELAALPARPARKGRETIDLFAESVLRYLLAASEPERKRILLIDGPAVIGWEEWRAIDAKYFGAATRAGLAVLLGGGAPARELDALTHLVLGAVMEAALVCATASDSQKAARDASAGMRRLLAGLAAEGSSG